MYDKNRKRKKKTFKHESKHKHMLTKKAIKKIQAK